MAPADSPKSGTQLSLREESNFLRQQLEESRVHLKAITQFTERQEVTLRRIKAKLDARCQEKTVSPQIENLQQGGLHYFEEYSEYQIQNELAEHIYQIGSGLLSNERADRALQTAMAAVGRPTYQDVINELQRVVQQHDKFRDSILAAVKKTAMVSLERNKANNEVKKLQGENKVLRKERNILQGRLDVLEDQGINIGRPRNELVGEARQWRLPYRKQNAKLDAAEDSAFPMSGEMGLDAILESGISSVEDFLQSAMLETELQNTTEEMEVPGTSDLPESQDTFVREGENIIDLISAEETLAEVDKAHLGGQFSRHEARASCSNAQQVGQGAQSKSALTDFDTEWVYNNSEDRIDWTDGEYDAYGGYSQSDEVEGIFYDNDGEFYHAERAIITDNSAPPSFPAEPPSNDTSHDYEGQLVLVQQECKNLSKQRDDAVNELEQMNRDLAEKRVERKGAHERVKLLEEEMAEYVTREGKFKAAITRHETTALQLREELRLGREEGSLADKLLVQLHEMKKRHEEVEEQRDKVTERLSLLQDEMHEADVRRGEDLERLKYLESTLAKQNEVMQGLQNHTNAALRIKDDEIRRMRRELDTKTKDSQQPLTARLNARGEEIQRINSELVLAKSELAGAKSAVRDYLNKITAAKLEGNAAQVQADKLAAELDIATQERNSTRKEAAKHHDEYDKVFQELVIKREIIRQVKSGARFYDNFGATSNSKAVGEEEDGSIGNASKATEDDSENDLFFPEHEFSRRDEELRGLLARTAEHAANFSKSTVITDSAAAKDSEPSKKTPESADVSQELASLRNQRDSTLLDLSRMTMDFMNVSQALERAQTELGRVTEQKNHAQSRLKTLAEERDGALNSTKETNNLVSDNQGANLAAARKDLDRIRAERNRLGMERDKARSLFTAMKEERDSALQECVDISRRLVVETQRADDHHDTIATLSIDIEDRIVTEVTLRSTIRDLEAARNATLSSPRGLGGLAQRQQHQSTARTKTGTSVDRSSQSDIPSPLNEVLSCTNLHDVIDMGGQNALKQPASPIVAISAPAIPFIPKTSTNISAEPEPAIRRSRRSTRNLAPVYVAPTSPIVPVACKPSRKRKAAMPEPEDTGQSALLAPQKISKRGKRRKAPADPAYVALLSPGSPAITIEDLKRKRKAVPCEIK